MDVLHINANLMNLDLRESSRILRNFRSLSTFSQDRKVIINEIVLISKISVIFF